MEIAHSLEAKVNKVIIRHNLMIKNKTYLVALSGGADSVCLLLILLELGYNIEAVHCNFNLRGEESERDENFCKTLCKKNNITLHIAHFDTKEYANIHKISVEMAARELRYAYFEHIRKKQKHEGICVAHHKEDNVETLIINLIRGTGIKGLTAMPLKKDYIIRPLLNVDKSEIFNYLECKSQNFVTDSSNLINNVVRNKIRLDIIPILQTINPAVVNNISKTINRLKDIEEIYIQQVNSMTKRVIAREFSTDENNECCVSLELLKKEINPEIILFEILAPLEFNSTQIEDIANSINGETGKRWSSKEFTALINRQSLLIQRKPTRVEHTLEINSCGTYDYAKKYSFTFTMGKIDNYFNISTSKNCITLDADKVKFPLHIRNIKRGDKFIPLGMTGSKLVSNFMTDIKASHFDKLKQLVVTDCEDNIVWLVNKRPDNRFKIDNKSKTFLQIEYNIE